MSTLVSDATDVHLRHAETHEPAPLEPHDTDPPSGGDFHDFDDEYRDVQVHFTKTPDIDLLQELMARHGFSTEQDVVRSAVAFYAWVSDQEELGDQFQIARKRGVDSYELLRPETEDAGPPRAAKVKPRHS